MATTTNDRGRKAELLVKQSLWRRDFRVKDMSSIRQDSGKWFDLLVNGRHRLEVKSIHGKESGTINLRHDDFDILCVVLCGVLRNSIYYLKDKGMLNELLKGSGVNITPRVLREYFTLRPGDVMPK